LNKKLPQDVILYEAFSFNDAWEGILKDWFIQAKSSVKNFVRAVVVPNEATVQFIKHELLKLDIALVGVQFFTPGTMRHFLSKANGFEEPVELRENLQLLMKNVANGFNENDIAKAAAIDPDQFVRLADTLESTGWTVDILKNKFAQALIKKYWEEKKAYGMVTIQDVQDNIYASSKAGMAIFSDLLIFGFSSRNWSIYKILISAVRSASKAKICLLTQHSERWIDQAWLGSWEEEFGESQKLLGELDPKVFSYLSNSFEELDKLNIYANADTENLPEFYIAQNILREAEVIVGRIAEALVNEEVLRLGVVFPRQTSPLAREVARVLEKEEIAHFNHLGYLGKNSQKRHLLELWVKWQKSPRLENFLTFLEVLMNEGMLSAQTFQSFSKLSRVALQTLLTDDLEVIFTYFALSLNDELVTRLIHEWKLLPKESTFRAYMESAREGLQAIISVKDWELTEVRGNIFLQEDKRLIKKQDFLIWLSSVTKVLGRKADYWGNHRYALVHLLTEEEALTQSWSHLILAGVNQGEWPSEKPELIFLDNKQINELNFRSLIKGSQGEGHFAVKDGLTLWVSSTDQYETSKMNFAVLQGMPSTKLILTAHKKDPQGKESSVSEFLERLYAIVEGRLLDEQGVKTILRDTDYWINAYRIKSSKESEQVFQEVGHAYRQRRKINEVFDEYSFSFKNPNKAALELSCKAWEEVLLSPQRAWFKHILKIEDYPVQMGKSLYSLAKGTWVHTWINHEKQGVQVNFEEWNQLIEVQARKVFEIVNKTFNSLNRELPDIWKAYWNEARRVTLSLIRTLSENLKDNYLFSEYPIISTEDARENAENNFLLNIPLKGRIDLIVYPLPVLESKDKPLWILDFKTGASGALTKDKVKKGMGIQLVLYGVKFHQEGFKQIEISIVQPGVGLKKQLDLKDILEDPSIFDPINNIFSNGKLGIRGTMERDYGSNFNFPLATIKIDEEILEKKWSLTHSNLEF